MKRTLLALALLAALAGCEKDADVASRNLSVDADNFKVMRRVVFYNGITDSYVLEIQGLCSKGNDDSPKKVTITCKVSPTEYKKHFLGVSDNVTYFMEQIDASKVSPHFYKVIFKPSVIIPNIEIR